jgi:hypothetical protein
VEITMMRKALCVLMAGVGLAAATVVSAHHSGAWFDRTRVIALEGAVVTAVEWRNPHFWVHFDVPDGKGGTQKWSLEGPSSNQVVDNGITPQVLKVGTKMTAYAFPGRDASKHHGSIRSIQVNGKQYLLQDVPLGSGRR